ncbi:MAG: signal recognition particle-docking protein FtsY [Chlamydiota bacterium]|nr:signal recognition particle-docking protein FtsY [Chlamydiota bacterium]
MVLKFLKSGYQSVKTALAKTGSLLGTKIRGLFQGEIDEDTLENLEQLLYEADLGVKTAMDLTEKIRQLHKKNPKLTADDYIEELKKEISNLLGQGTHGIIKTPDNEGPTIILVVGVNGSGKTTSIAKIAKTLTDNNLKVLVGAADTFRAAAIDQLELWAKRIGIDIVKGKPGSDPAAVAFDAISAGKARGCDYVIIDTAGRLQNKTHLMQELEKIKRTCKKIVDSAPHETLLVIDANTGQNGIDQAKTFNKYTPITGLVLTKLDGSAKGGVVLGAQKELNIPVKFIGVGESIEDLKPFSTESYVSALFD